jgi:hypothetical protein
VLEPLPHPCRKEGAVDRLCCDRPRDRIVSRSVVTRKAEQGPECSTRTSTRAYHHQRHKGEQAPGECQARQASCSQRGV